MKKSIIFIVAVFILVACSPSPEKIQQAIDETQTAIVASYTDTPEPTNTSEPTDTPIPTNTATKTSSPSTTPPIKPTNTSSVPPQEQFIKIITDALSLNNDIEKISTVKGENGKLIIEVFIKWASKDRQPIVSYDLIKLLADIFKGSNRPEKTYAWWCGNENESFGVDITTYSTDGNYRYKSFTNYETLDKLFKKLITYEEWKSLSGAGFK